MRVFADTETFNEVPITVGSYKYAETAEVIISAWAVDDGPVRVEDGLHPDFVSDLAGADEQIWQNSPFDRIVLRHQGVHIPVEKITDTMTIALAHSLPGKLEQLCVVLGLPEDKAKDKDGKRLINLFAKPRPRKMKLRRATRDTHPEDWEKFRAYAGMDVISMREVYYRLPRWNWTPIEIALWRLDQVINDRGVMADADLAVSALRAFGQTKDALSLEASDMTEGAVGSLTQRDRLLDHLKTIQGNGPEIENLQKGNIADLLKRPDVPEQVRELLEMRLQAAAASPAKYRAVINSACADGRLRGMTQFCGASRTGRDSGRIVQLQNLPRPTLPIEQINNGIDAMKLGVEDLIAENVSEMCVNAVRGCLVAAPGKKLVIADLSNIEGRVLAWLAGEEWKLQAFRDYDRGIGHDLYKLTAGRILGKRPEDITKDERQGQGKVPELACGYQGAVGAFLAMGAVYGVVLPEERIIEIVKAWRAAHPRIKSLWYDLEGAAKMAIREPDASFTVRSLRFDMKDGYLRLRLPSGRYLSYSNARIDRTCKPCEGTGKIVKRGVFADCEPCGGTGEDKPKIVYDGVNQYTRKWGPIYTYGGKFAENATQAVARDVFMHGLKGAEGAGYPVVVRVHDELVTEVPDKPQYSAEKLSKIMAANPSWSIGLPLAAAGHEGYRYAKEG